MLLGGYIYANPDRVVEAQRAYDRRRTTGVTWTWVAVCVFVLLAFVSYSWVLPWLSTVFVTMPPLVFVAAVFAGPVIPALAIWTIGTNAAERRWQRALDDDLARDARTLFENYAAYGSRPDAATVWRLLLDEEAINALRQDYSLQRRTAWKGDESALQATFDELSAAEDRQRQRLGA